MNEGDNLLETYFSYSVVIRSPLNQIEKLRQLIQALEETRIVMENVSTRNQYITFEKPPQKSVIDRDTIDE